MLVTEFDLETSVGPCLTEQTRVGSLDRHLGARRWSDQVTGSDLGPKKPEREQISQPTRNCGPFGPPAETAAWPREMGRGRDRRGGREVNTVAERVANPSRRRRVDLSSRKDP